MKHEDSAHPPLAELIKEQGFRWVSPDITNKRFPAPDRLWDDYRRFRFGKKVSSEEAVKRMKEQGYEPANSHELVLWEGWNEKDAAVALGSVTKVGGYRSVLYLDRNGSKRDLYLSWWDDNWNASCHFLAVRNPSCV